MKIISEKTILPAVGQLREKIITDAHMRDVREDVKYHSNTYAESARWLKTYDAICLGIKAASSRLDLKLYRRLAATSHSPQHDVKLYAPHPARHMTSGFTNPITAKR